MASMPSNLQPTPPPTIDRVMIEKHRLPFSSVYKDTCDSLHASRCIAAVVGPPVDAAAQKLVSSV